MTLPYIKDIDGISKILKIKRISNKSTNNFRSFLKLLRSLMIEPVNHVITLFIFIFNVELCSGTVNSEPITWGGGPVVVDINNNLQRGLNISRQSVRSYSTSVKSRKRDVDSSLGFDPKTLNRLETI